MEQLELVVFIARIIAFVIPALDIFNVGAAIATGSHVPPDYLFLSTVYTCAYSMMAILLAFLLFEERDLA